MIIMTKEKRRLSKTLSQKINAATHRINNTHYMQCTIKIDFCFIPC